MPSRILREGILTSERVNSLSWEAEVFYRRLMSVVDDYGRFTAHLSLLRAALYPLKLETVRDANLERLLASVVQARLVRVYEVDGKRYLEMLDFRQQVRAKESKFPAPDGQALAPCAADAKQVPSTPAAPALVFGVGDEVEDDSPRGARGEGGGSSELESPQPTAAGLVCLALRQAGLARANPAHPMLLMLLEAGATIEEFVAAAAQAVGKRDPFAYLLTVVKTQREEAAQASKLVHAGPLPAQAVTVASDAHQRTQDYLQRQQMTPEQRTASVAAARQARQKLRGGAAHSTVE